MCSKNPGKLLPPTLGTLIGGQTGAFLDPVRAIADPDEFSDPVREPERAPRDPGRTASDSDGPNKVRARLSIPVGGSASGLRIPV